MNMLGKDLENERQRKKVPSFLKKIVNFCFFSYLQYITEWGFLKKNLIQNTDFGRSWKHTPLIIFFLRKPK